MNLNPFIFSYRQYPKSKLATAVNQFCSCMQRIFLIFTILITLVVVVEAVENWGEALLGATGCFSLWLLLKLKKDKWSDAIAAKQEKIDKLEE